MGPADEMDPPRGIHGEEASMRILLVDGDGDFLQRVRQGLSLHYFCPQKVITYIETHKLYH